MLRNTTSGLVEPFIFIAQTTWTAFPVPVKGDFANFCILGIPVHGIPALIVRKTLG